MIDKKRRLLLPVIVAALLAVAGEVRAWTDDPIVAGTTPIRAVHITELRAAINAKRLEFGMSSFTFATDPAVIAGTTLVRPTHFTDMRTAINDIRTAFHPVGGTHCTNLDVVPLLYTFTDALTAGSTVIRATHTMELRQALDQIGTARQCCGFCRKGNGTTCLDQLTTDNDMWNDCPPVPLALNKFNNCYTGTCSGGACQPVTAGNDPSNQCPPLASDLSAVPWGVGKVVGCYATPAACDGTGGCPTVGNSLDPNLACGACLACDNLGGCTGFIPTQTDPKKDCSGRCNVCNGIGGCTFVTSTLPAGDVNNDCPPPQIDLNAATNHWAGCYGANCGGTTTECQLPTGVVAGACPPSQANLNTLVPGKKSQCFLTTCNGAGGCTPVLAQSPPTLDDLSVCAKCYACDGTGGCTPVTAGNQATGCNTSVGSCNGASSCDGTGNCVVTNPPAGNKGAPPCSMCKACDGLGSCNGNVAGGTNDTGCNLAVSSCISAPQTCNGTGGCNYNYRAQGNKGTPSCPMCYSCDATGGCTNPMTGLQDALMGCNIPGGQCKDSIDTCNNDGTCNKHYSALGTKSTCPLCYSCGSGNGSCSNPMTGLQDALMGCNIPGGQCKDSIDTCNNDGTCNKHYSTLGTKSTCPLCYSCGNGNGSCTNPMTGLQDALMGCNIPAGQCKDSIDSCNSDGTCNNHYSALGTKSTCPQCKSCGNGDGSCTNNMTGQDTLMGCNLPAGQCKDSPDSCSGGSCNHYYSALGTKSTCPQCKSCGNANGSCTNNMTGQDTLMGCNLPAGQCKDSPDSCSGGSCNHYYSALGTKSTCPMCYSCGNQNGSCTNPMTGLQDNLYGCNISGGQCKDSIDTCNSDGTCNKHYSALNTKSTCPQCKSCGNGNGSCTNNMSGQDVLGGCAIAATLCRSADSCSGGFCNHTNSVVDTDCGTCSGCDGNGNCTVYESSQNGDCTGLCQKCGGLGSCTYQSTTEDLKGECPKAGQSSYCTTGNCNNAGDCGITNNGGTCNQKCGRCNSSGQCAYDSTQNWDCASCYKCSSLGNCVAENGEDLKTNCPSRTPTGYESTHCDTGLCAGGGNCGTATAVTCYPDLDGDGYCTGTAHSFCFACGSGYKYASQCASFTDCDDTPATGGSVHDNVTCYYDWDGDTYGDPASPGTFCGSCPTRWYQASAGAPNNNLDCDENNTNVHPWQGSYFNQDMVTNSGYAVPPGGTSNIWDYDCNGTTDLIYWDNTNWRQVPGLGGGCAGGPPACPTNWSTGGLSCGDQYGACADCYENTPTQCLTTGSYATQAYCR